ncbi:hypothetical protein KUV22_02420 [Microbulbifer agarilyticus]|uniref:hypothetical protein n=1 Tax=Microbulbifer agarilyticus TaxID=260552 RepID=UPI001C98BD6D|nr:hypothetical protein [Microbulbifer agarilyticus]MBY6189264.1 hypothetical protein [Microbulbifer agarilyticus]
MLTDQQKQLLSVQIQANKHEIYVISFEEMDAIVKSSPNGTREQVQAAWKKLKGTAEAGAGYSAAADDAVTLTRLVGDLGGVGARAYIKNYGGRPHIILKGRPGLRNILTGTKYGIKNPKVVNMGLGRSGAVAAARQGGILTMVLLISYRVVDYALTDEATLSRLIGTLATDVVKVGITTAASIATAVFVGGFTLAVGPIAAVLVVGVGVSMLLEYADQSYGITNRVVACIDELESRAKSAFRDQQESALESARDAANSLIALVIDSARSVVIHWVRRNLREYISPVRSVW